MIIIIVIIILPISITLEQCTEHGFSTIFPGEPSIFALTIRLLTLTFSTITLLLFLRTTNTFPFSPDDGPCTTCTKSPRVIFHLAVSSISGFFFYNKINNNNKDSQQYSSHDTFIGFISCLPRPLPHFDIIKTEFIFIIISLYYILILYIYI